MIIQIRGTSGSGKSTLVRRIMDLYDHKYPVKQKVTEEHPKPRKQPIGYMLQAEGGVRSLAVVGHYETACGGTDTINGFDYIYQLIKDAHEAGRHVLYEGLLASAEVNRAVDLLELDTEFLCICLDTDIDVCEASIIQRRADKAAAAGREPKPFGPNFRKNLESKHKGTQTAFRRLTEAGAIVKWADRDEAFRLVAEALGHVPAQSESH